MAYTATGSSYFASGETLSASKLNVLSGNTEYLKGVLDAPNVPLQTITATGGTTVDFWFRHALDYFHWKFTITAGESDTIWIKLWDIDGTLVTFGGALPDGKILNDTATWTPAQEPVAVWTDSYNVSSLTASAWYRAEVNMGFTSGSGPMYLVYLEERATA